MEYFIGCDSHKKYSVFVIVDERGAASKPVRVEHDRSLMRQFLNQLPVGSRIALEAGGHYYWLVDEMEKAGHLPHLTHPLEAKKRMGKTAKKTDGVDSRGLAILLRNGTLPTVWIPPAELRDQRELLRLRMFFVGQQTRLKNRIHGTLARYNLRVGVKDIYSVDGRRQLQTRLGWLPSHTQEGVQLQLATLDVLALQIEEVEGRLEAITQLTPQAERLKTLPGVGRILSMVIALEIGDVDRFPSSAHLASYAGLAPRVRSSGGRTRMGQVCGDVNRYLKWAFVEAANVTVMHQRRLAGTHVVELYRRVQRKQNHQKAAVAVGRHLAEAAFWVLKKQEAYREPGKIFHPGNALSSTHGSARCCP